MIKSYELTLKDVDTKEGIVEGYFSVFHNVDADGDIMLPGAFTKTIQENGPASKQPRIKHLLDHDTTKRLGFLQSLEQDDHGLKFRSKLTKATIGRDALIQYEEGILTEHSFGFELIQAERNNETGIQEISEVKMWEGSTVTWGANSLAGVSKIKGLSIPEQTENLKQKIEHWTKVLYKGELSDDACFLLQIQLQQIKDYLESLGPELSTSADDVGLVREFANQIKPT